ncbi:hypothetical protein BGZ61DRAFT_443645 [Ilyonectria robusta]|uniref:uncharacterized protein n=1 Tax=Ilyonectria robusta TaxID=1079257 RepID=UPI001E8D3A70|nr:uncharacterized protein BGZ61DRAFT_443645 [Ilyonectria robusta]KAH8735059.1 hypothetical protein BGZ61DRAFT_443645 [Ilyonectria robusta]
MSCRRPLVDCVTMSLLVFACSCTIGRSSIVSRSDRVPIGRGRLPRACGVCGTRSTGVTTAPRIPIGRRGS